MEDVRILTLLSNAQANADTHLDTRKCTFSQFSSNSAQSTALNVSRLEVLRAREEHLQSIFDDTRSKIKSLASSKGDDKYASTVENLILEILLLLLSPDITIQYKKSEEKVIKNAGDKALKRYKDVSGRDSKIEYVGDLAEES